MPLTTNARGVRDRADEGARSNGARAGQGGRNIGFLELLRVFGQDKI